MMNDERDLQILGLIGEGVNSSVYKGFQISQQLGVTLPVAIKVLKSKTNIELLRNECEKLIKVRSRYCVALYGWRTVDQQPALILEYIDGITLLEFWQSGFATPDLVHEILAQAFMGIKDLSSFGLAHGDLNLTNIMIDRDGVVRLLDFGFFSGGVSHVTPEFASAAVLMGEKPDLTSDLVSLEKIRKYLLRKKLQGNIFDLTSKPELVQKLSEHIDVLRAHAKRSEKTVGLDHGSVKAKGQQLKRGMFLNYRYAAALMLLVFTLSILNDSGASKMAPMHKIEVRTLHWVRIQVDGVEVGYAPRDIWVNSGKTNITWTTAKGAGAAQIQVEKPVLRLNDDFFSK